MRYIINILLLLLLSVNIAIGADIYANRVGETTRTTGTGTIALDGAKTGYRTFVSTIGDGNTCKYLIINAAGQWEIGSGTVTDAATDTLSRDTVESSSSADAAVNFSAGPKTVYCVLSADQVATILVDTDNQTIDVLSLIGTELNISLEDDGEVTQTVDLAGLQDGTGTDDQTASEVNATDNFVNSDSTDVQNVLEDFDSALSGGGVTVQKDLVTTAPISGGEDNIFVGADADVTLSMHVADTDNDGYLSSTDWDTFNSKLSAEVDGSVSNEINTITGDDSNATTGLGITVAGGGINATTVTGDTVTITGTEVDGSVSNEINTFTADDAGTTSGLAVTLAGAGTIATTRSGDTITITGTGDGTGTDDQTATEVSVTDSENDFIGENVETVLHEMQDSIEGLGGGHDSATLDANADSILSLTDQEFGLDTQNANKVFAGPATGADAVPTVRSLVADDIPDLSGTYLTAEVDGSVSNELNLITADTGGTTSGLNVSIIGSGAISTSRAGDTITVSATAGLLEVVDDLTPQLGGDLDMQSNSIEGVDATEMGYLDNVTSGIQAQLNAKLESEVDGSVSNEINTIQGDDDGATTGLAISIDGAGIVTTDVVGDVMTITGTEVDGSTTNEINTITTPDAEATEGLAITFADTGIMTITESGDTVTFDATEVDSVVGAITGVPVADGAGNISTYDHDAADLTGSITSNLILGDADSPTTSGEVGYDGSNIEVGNGTGTDIFIPEGEDSSYEGTLTNSAGLKSALSDELDGGDYAVFADSFATGASDNGILATKGYVDDNSGAGGMTWTEVSVDTQMVVNTGYIADSSLNDVTFTLPATGNVTAFSSAFEFGTYTLLFTPTAGDYCYGTSDPFEVTTEGLGGIWIKNSLDDWRLKIWSIDDYDLPVTVTVCDTVKHDQTITPDGSYEICGETDFLWYASEFISDNSFTVCRADAYLFKAGDSSETLTAYIYSDTGAHAPNSLITTSTNTITISDLTSTPGAYEEFTFDSGSLISGTSYWLVIKASAVVNNLVYWQRGNDDSTPENQYTSPDGTTWTVTNGSRTTSFRILGN